MPIVSSPTEAIIGSLYTLLGPVAWLVFLFGMLKGRRRLSLLRRSTHVLPQPAPAATILVPVKDEAAKIGDCLRSVLAQDYPHFRVIAIDDRSTDGTGEILDSIAREQDRLTVIHVRRDELPDGWAGKTHALHAGVRHAKSRWLLFVDSDVTLEPDALSACVALAELRRYDLVSLLPRMICESFWEKLIMPLGAAATSAMHMLPMTNYNELPRIAFANGQFLLVRRRAYETVGGHEAVRGMMSEDIGLARNLKRIGFRPRLAIGDSFIATRMYDSFETLARGWSRNFFSGDLGRPHRIIAAMLFVIVGCFSAYAAIVFGLWRGIDWGWIAAGFAHLSIMTVALSLAYHWTNRRPGFALLFPIGGAVMLMIFLRALRMCFGGKVEWRGTRYAHARGRGVVAPIASTG